MDPHRNSVQNAGVLASGARTATPLVIGIPPWGISIFQAYLLVVIPGRGLFFRPKDPLKCDPSIFPGCHPWQGPFFFPKRPLKYTFGPTLSTLGSILLPLGSIWVPLGCNWGPWGLFGLPRGIFQVFVNKWASNSGPMALKYCACA